MKIASKLTIKQSKTIQKFSALRHTLLSLFNMSVSPSSKLLLSSYRQRHFQDTTRLVRWKSSLDGPCQSSHILYVSLHIQCNLLILLNLNKISLVHMLLDYCLDTFPYNCYESLEITQLYKASWICDVLLRDMI